MMKWKRLHKRILPLVMTLSFLFLSVTSVAHAHKAESNISDHCSVCQISSQSRSADLEKPFQLSFNILIQEIASESLAISPFVFISLGKLSQAPPQA
ncbi:MAG: hypothetical protein JNK65_02170 [Deltaproteobacteria bacterium]|nr:hypothetical protein [Deltaproteobacteria bacterium]